MKKTIFRNWNFMRVVRLVMGIVILVESVILRDALLGIAGLLFSSMAIFNVGCGGTGGCYTPTKKRAEDTKAIIYEEVV